jgi:putative ABC transport system permease protein
MGERTLKSYRKLTPIYLKSQKKKTISVLTAIILAAALSISMMILSRSNNQNAINTAEYINGKEHAIFTNMKVDEISRLKKEKGISEIATRELLGYGKLKNGAGIAIEGFDKKSIDMEGYSIRKGRFPIKQDEIAIEGWALRNLRLKNKLGQKINIQVESCQIKKSKIIGNKSKIADKYIKTIKFKLVGILNDNYQSKITHSERAIIAYGSAKKILPSKFLTYDAFIRIKSRSNMMEKINAIAKKFSGGDSAVYPNTKLLWEYEILSPGEDSAASDESFSSFVAQNFPVTIAVLMIIFNIFSMSILNKTSEFGIMRSIGAKPSQIRRLIYGEAGYMVLIAVPIGLLLGMGVSKVLLIIAAKSMGTNADIAAKLYIPITNCVFGIVLIICAVFIAVTIPAYKAGRVSPIEAITGGTGYIKSGKIKTGAVYRLSMKRFGISFNIALQNIWRSRKRFIITVLCMSICGVLYIGERNATCSEEIYENRVSKSQEILYPFLIFNAPFQLSTSQFELSTIKRGYSQKDYSNILKMQGVDKAEVVKSDSNAEIIADKAHITPKFAKFLSEEPQAKGLLAKNKIKATTIGLTANDVKKCKNFLKSGTINLKEMKQKPVILLANTFSNFKTKKISNMTSYKVGDVIKVKLPFRVNNTYSEKMYEFIVGGILTDEWRDAYGKVPSGFPVIVMSENMFKKLTSSLVYQEVGVDIKKGLSKREIKKISLQLEKIGLSIPQGYFYNSMEEDQKDVALSEQEDMIKNGIMLSLIIIAIVNIFNTMATTLIMRRKEFGLLKIVGITMRQLKNMVVIEVVIYALASTALAFAGGILLGYWKLNDEFKYSPGMKYHFSISGTLIVLCAYLIFSLLAAILPLKRVIKSNAVESIKMVD